MCDCAATAGVCVHSSLRMRVASSSGVFFFRSVIDLPGIVFFSNINSHFICFGSTFFFPFFFVLSLVPLSVCCCAAVSGILARVCCACRCAQCVGMALHCL